MRFTSALLLLCASTCHAFVVVPSATTTTTTTAVPVRATPATTFQQVAAARRNSSPSTSAVILHAEDTDEDAPKKKKRSGLDPTVRDKLVTESIAPWRTLRLFLYVAAGSGALIGGLITLTGAIAAFTQNRPDVDMNTEYLNLAIDFGFVAAFGVLYKFDSDQGVELDEAVQAKVVRKKEAIQLTKGMREREGKVKELSLQITVSVDGTTKEATAGDLQRGAKQHMIIVVGPKKAIRDALVGANLIKNDFSLSNVLVVPYDTGMAIQTVSTQAPAAEGFGSADRPAYETQPFVARPTGDGWEEYIQAEMDDAVTQSGERAKKEGIAIVIANTGKVLRRGVGTVPWRQMVDELIGKEDEDLPLI